MQCLSGAGGGCPVCHTTRADRPCSAPRGAVSFGEAEALVPQRLSLFQRDCANSHTGVSPQDELGLNLHGALCTLIVVTSCQLPRQCLKSRGEGCIPASYAQQLIPTPPCLHICLPGQGLWGLDPDRSMRLLFEAVVLCLTLGLGQCSEETTQENTVHQASQAESTYSEWGIGAIRDSFETVNSYFDSFLELLGGKNGVCQYRCRYGKAPMPRPHYKPQEPNGCSSYFLGLKVPESLDLGIPAMTKCCNQLDICYDTCGANKYRCDAKFRWCLHSICSDLKRSLGFVSKVEGRLPSSHALWREQAVAGRGGCGQGALTLPKEAKICCREQHICPVLVIEGSGRSETPDICPLHTHFCPKTRNLKIFTFGKHYKTHVERKETNNKRILEVMPSTVGCPPFKGDQKAFQSQ
uniref:Phospholipase A2 group XIIB n=1 Tax=Falco tinnunculus TaxID=100819 RepID=A0A8C4U3E4_FALTI